MDGRAGVERTNISTPAGTTQRLFYAFETSSFPSFRSVSMSSVSVLGAKVNETQVFLTMGHSNWTVCSLLSLFCFKQFPPFYPGSHNNPILYTEEGRKWQGLKMGKGIHSKVNETQGFLYLGHSNWTICSLLSWICSKKCPPLYPASHNNQILGQFEKVCRSYYLGQSLNCLLLLRCVNFLVMVWVSRLKVAQTERGNVCGGASKSARFHVLRCVDFWVRKCVKTAANLFRSPRVFPLFVCATFTPDISDFYS